MKANFLKLITAAALTTGLLACQKTPAPAPDNDKEPADTTANKPQPPVEEPEETLKLLPDYKKVTKFPTVTITTDGGAEVTSKEIYIGGNITFNDPEGMYSDVKEVSGRMKIRGRGNTTWGLPKKPYKVKLDKSSALFGMNPDKDWALLAEYTDQTLLRNLVSMQISRIVGMPWTPDGRTVEVYFNGEYQGVYTLMEHKKISPYRVNIKEAPVDVVDGGYYLELDEKDDDDIYFKTRTFYKKIKFKGPDEPTDEQYAFAQKLINDIEKVLNKEDFSEESGYRNYIDVESWIGNYIVQELTKNIDGNMRLSTYFAREQGSKVWIANVWDFDRAIGNCEYFRSEYGITSSYSEWFVKDYGGRPFGYEEPNGQRSYYQCLFNDPTFVQEVKDKWNEVKPNLETIPAYIDALVDLNQSAIDREWKEWSSNHGGHRYSDEVKSMKEFYTNRLNWIDRNIRNL